MAQVKLPENARIDAEHIWRQVFSHPGKKKDWAIGRPALFLDRDGVIVEEAHYLSHPKNVHLIPGAADIIRKANRRDLPVVIITNQSGIARGYFGWSEFAAVQRKMLDDLAELGALVDAVYACPHHKSGAPPYGTADHPARKPNPGMILIAGEMLELDLSASWIIGDKASDLAAGRNGGLAGGVHVLTGHGHDEGEVEKALALGTATFIVGKEKTIGDCAKAIPSLR